MRKIVSLIIGVCILCIFSLVLIGCGGAPDCSNPEVKKLTLSTCVSLIKTQAVAAGLLDHGFYDDASKISNANVDDYIERIRNCKDYRCKEIAKDIDESEQEGLFKLENYELSTITCESKDDKIKKSKCSAVLKFIPENILWNVDYSAYNTKEGLVVSVKIRMQ